MTDEKGLGEAPIVDGEIVRMRLPVQQSVPEHDGALEQGRIFAGEVGVNRDRVVVGEGGILQRLVTVALGQPDRGARGIGVHHEVLKREGAFDGVGQRNKAVPERGALRGCRGAGKQGR